MVDILSEIRKVLQDALDAGIPREEVVVSLSNQALGRLIEQVDSEEKAELLNQLRLTCDPDQTVDVALAKPKVATSGESNPS